MGAELTVAIPTCNGARHIGEALRSIVGQDRSGVELIVCDDRSEDRTAAIVREVAGDAARLAINSERLGLARNWNRCVESAQSGWVAVFHQDDLMLAGHLARVLATIRAFGERRVGLIAGRAEVVDASGRPAKGIEAGELAFPPPHDRLDAATVFGPGEFVRELAVANPLRCSAVVLRKAAHAEAGGFDPAYRYAVDWDFWLRVARGWGVAWRTGPPTVAFRWHAASETHRFRKDTVDLEEQERLLDELFARDAERLPDAEGLQAAGRRRLARAYVNRAYDASRARDRALAHRCLRRAFNLHPRALGRLVTDPRLLARVMLSR